MNTMKLLNEKRNELLALNAVVRRLEDQVTRKELIPRLMALVGTYWKYRNSYSCPDGPKDYWWLYRKIVGVQGTSLVCAEFQTDKYGETRIKNEKHVISLSEDKCPMVGRGWQESSKAEWKRAIMSVQRKIRSW